METLVDNLRRAMTENLVNVAWMDEPTKKHALAKLNRMRQKIGYPDYINNITKIMHDFRGVSSPSAINLSWLQSSLSGNAQ